jgi:galactokinase
MRERVVAAFRELTGRIPQVVVRAPGRVNLIGDHTDYNDGFVLPAAIERATWMAATPRNDAVIRVRSIEQGVSHLDLEALEQRGDWTDYLSGTIWALGGASQGFDVTVGTTIPVGAGLSSSAAFELATARLVYEFEGRTWDPVDAALAAQRAENDFVGMPCGIMDQLIVATAQPDAANLIDCRSLETTPARVPDGAVVVILDTTTRRRLVGSAYEERRAACERVATRLGVAALRDADRRMLDEVPLDPIDRRRALHVVDENRRTRAAAAALDDGDAAAAGRLMDESHASLRDLYEVTGPALDAIVEIARAEPGCWGARMTGAGFAGCAVALVAADHIDPFSAAVARRFEATTGLEPAIYPTRPAAGVAVE